MDENVTKVRDLMRSDRRLTIRMISSVLNLNRQTVHEILTFELGMKKICAKLVPKILTNEQKENQRNASKMTKKISNMSLQVMKRGFSNTILTPKTKFGVAHEQLTAPKESKKMSKSKPC